MKTKTKYLVIILLAFTAIYSCNPKPKRVDIKNNKELKPVVYNFDNPPSFVKEGELSFISKDTKDIIATFDMDLATTNEERALGLMYRKEMKPNQGMLFVFENEEIQSFWMRNTIISLDMVFVNREKEIVTIHKSTPTLTDKSFASQKPALYVIELNAGTCDSLNIKEGDIISY